MGKTKIGSMKHLTLVEGDVNLLTNNEVLVSEEEDYTILRKLESGEIKTFVVIPLEDFNKNEEIPTYAENPLQQIEDLDVKNSLMQAIEKLPEKERTIISLYYYEGLTLKEISLVFGLTEARISQLHTKAVYRLRGALLR